MKYLRTLLIATFVIIGAPTNAQNNALKVCWKKQVQPLDQQYLAFSFQEEISELGHNFEPWQLTPYKANGKLWINAEDFYKQDTLTNGSRVYHSKTSLHKSELLFLDYGDKELFPVTKELTINQIIKSARYFPANLINYFFKQNVQASEESTKELAVYETAINNTIVRLFIRRSNALLVKVTTMHNDDLFGDVLTSLDYSDFTSIGKLYFAQRIDIDRFHGKIKEHVTLAKPEMAMYAPNLIERPIDYKLKESSVNSPDISVNKHNDRIFFIELKHTDDRAMLVEFTDFLLIAEAPINSANGELIIAEARKISPYKPIRYFVFGHHHPHYIGGVRAFIHKGAKIVCTAMDEEYLSYIAQAPHTLVSDSLHLQKRKLEIETIKDSLLISDGSYEMKIYFIGQKSQHTKDYLIYYFPKEKLLFEDDLVWIPKSGEIKKAGARQLGLYHAIRELGLQVETIVQSWPVLDYGVKTIIPFADLETSIGKK